MTSIGCMPFGPATRMLVSSMTARLAMGVSSYGSRSAIDRSLSTTAPCQTTPLACKLKTAGASVDAAIGEPFLCLGLGHGHESPHCLSQEWMPHPKDRRLGDIPRFEQHAFHLHRKDLLPADIDDLGGAPDKTDQPGLLLYKIACIHPAI